MTRTITRTRLLALASTLALAAGAAQAGKLETLKPANLEGGRKLNVTTTVNFVSDLAQQIGGDRVNVSFLMGPGVDPHLYKASAGDVRKLGQADLIFYGGLFLEGKMGDLLEENPRAVAVSDAIPRERLIQPKGGFAGRYAFDPHIWFDVTLWKFAAGHVRDALSRVDPANRTTYANNAQTYLARLDQLDAFVKQQIARVPQNQRVMITAHDAFSYFGRRYGVEVRGLQGVSTAVEAGARDVQELANFLASRKIRAIFVESSVPERTVNAVVQAARAKGWNLKVGGKLYSDAAGDPGTPEGTYVGMVEHNVRTFVAALLGEG